MRKSTNYVILLLPLSLVISYLATYIPEKVEIIYSTVMFRFFSQILNYFNAFFSISLAELFIIFSIIYFLIRIVDIIKLTKKYEILTLARNGAIIVSILYFLFIMLWGLNYHRLPFSQMAQLNTSSPSIEELEVVCHKLADDANNLNKTMEPKQKYYNVFTRAQKGYQIISKTYPELTGKYTRAKKVALSDVLSYMGISGFYFPFTGEANINTNIPPCTLPSTVCHEMAHQRGIAREDEANYISYLVCTNHPDPDFKYSGTLLALIYCSAELRKHSLDKYYDLNKKYNDNLMEDLRSINKFWSKYQGPIEKISSNINDAYLKSNMQNKGIKSYGEMVDLVIAEYRKTKSP